MRYLLDTSALIAHYRSEVGGTTVQEFFDAAGRRVRELCEDRRSAGTQALAWDGRDDRGRNVAAGVYIVRVVASGTANTARVLIVR